MGLPGTIGKFLSVHKEGQLQYFHSIRNYLKKKVRAHNATGAGGILSTRTGYEQFCATRMLTRLIFIPRHITHTQMFGKKIRAIRTYIYINIHNILSKDRNSLAMRKHRITGPSNILFNCLLKLSPFKKEKVTYSSLPTSKQNYSARGEFGQLKWS